MAARWIAIVLAAVTFGGAAPQPTSFLITNAVVLDGSGAPGRRVSVRVNGDRITVIGNLTAAAGERVVDARGLTLAPGFIDTHSHHDRGLADERDALGAVTQGITTIVVGQDGGSSSPLAESFAKLEAAAPAVNIASYVGHGTLRRRVMGTDFKRVATADEVAKMVEMLRAEMQAGALGLSTGLEYDPGIYSDPSEVVALAKAVAPFGGRYISHIRSEDREFWKAIDEAINIGRQAKIPVQISHIKLAMRSLWGQHAKLLGILNAARKEGIRLTADIYPYTYWQSGMTVLFPARDFANRASAEFALREVTSPEGLLVVRYSRDRSYEGKTLAEIAKLRGTDPPQTMMDMLKEAGEGDIGIVATSMDEKDVAEIMKWPFANICSDGTSTGGHPRGFGAFTRVLGRYVREQRVLTLPDAIRRMTSMSATNVGLKQRGLIAQGNYADLVLFDPATVIDRATTKDPRALSEGIDTVWVNGQIVYQSGKATGQHPGQILRR
jgi:N-acyl-D-amino-acid deacylase